MIKGFDTSKWQNSKVDYAKAKKAGYEFVILRIGYSNTLDKCFEKDYASAISAGLKVGVYFYTYSTSISQAEADATRVLGWLNNRHLDLPVYYDMEDAKQKGADRKALNTNMFNAFASRIKAKGYGVGLYTGEYFFNHYFNKSGIDTNLWIAKYSPSEPAIGRAYQMWQYTSDEIKSTFYNGKLDRNYFYGTLPESEKKVIKNPYPVPTRTLKYTLPRMKGNDVKWLQYELGIKIDGDFGKLTKSAVMTYQKAQGLKQDGIVGSATRYALLND